MKGLSDGRLRAGLLRRFAPRNNTKSFTFLNDGKVIFHYGFERSMISSYKSFYIGLSFSINSNFFFRELLSVFHVKLLEFKTDIKSTLLEYLNFANLSQLL
jgi:hypothetical protein